MSIADLSGLRVTDELLAARRLSLAGKTARDIYSDGLYRDFHAAEFHPTPMLADEVHICFWLLFQGDRIRVEVATAAHEQLLQRKCLLNDDERLVAGRPFSGDFPPAKRFLRSAKYLDHHTRMF